MSTQMVEGGVATARLERVRAALAASNSSLGLVLLLVVTWTVFGIGGSGFLGSFNLYSVVQLAARDAVLGMAQAALLVVARVNLAVGSIGAICASLLGYLLVSVSVPLPLALLSVCVVGVLASVLMGVVELRSGLSSFIVTLAFLSAYGGAALLVTRADQYEITSQVLNRLGNGSLFASSICPLVVVALVCGVLVWLLYTRNGLGWRMLAVGSNEQAARVSGVNVPVVVLASYAISGLLCAVAAVMESAYQLNVNAGVGSDWLLPSFIAPILGGVALSGGDISVIGILLAALFYDSLQSGLTILNVPSYWLELAEGVVLLVAVVLDQLRRVRRRQRRYRPPDVATVLREEVVA
jgi:ribose transport system permease protein